MCFKSSFIVDVASTKGKNLKSLLGTSLKDTYEMYPYRESHGTRALSRQECHMYMYYLYTTRERM